jgi:hypothetical protein
LRRSLPPRSVEDRRTLHRARRLAYFYFEEEARRIAANIAVTVDSQRG